MPGYTDPLAPYVDEENPGPTPLNDSWTARTDVAPWPIQQDELRSYSPTMRERVAQFLYGDQRPSVARRNLVEGLLGRGGADPRMGLVDFTPIGMVMGGQEGQRAAERGDFLGAASGAMAAMPAARAALKPAAAEAAELLGRFATTKPNRIVNQTRAAGGYSVNLPSGELPTEGLMVGKYANADPRNTVVDTPDFGAKDVAAHAKKNKAALNRPDAYLGTWQDPETGKTYLDVSQRFPPEEIRGATKFGERTGQLAGYNVGKGETFPIGNWPEFIAGPEFHDRMGQMQKAGADYLSQHPTKDWWDMHGTAFERVYGPESMPQLAGFIASTAPNNAPKPNLQQASEYMRRFIKGEPPVQPDWRVPDTAMSRTPGSQIGMENARVDNLNRAYRGALGELQKDKVREEAQALMGDPNAVVLDRHWARIAEKPSAGVFTNTQEGVVKDEGYQQLKDQVTRAAQAAGVSPRDYSAQVWTGIREQLKNNAELFGQQYKKGAIQGESKGYADIFTDLIADKAKHLGISVQEMERRLKSGDAELLSVMLGVPAVAAAYSSFSGGGPRS